MLPAPAIALVLIVANSQPIPVQPPPIDCEAAQINSCACRDFAVGVPVGYVSGDANEASRSDTESQFCPQGLPFDLQTFAVGVPVGREGEDIGETESEDGFAVGVPVGREAEEQSNSNDDGFAVGVPVGREAGEEANSNDDGFAVGVPVGREAGEEEDSKDDSFAVGVPVGREAGEETQSDDDGFAVGVPVGKYATDAYTPIGWQSEGASQAYAAEGVLLTAVNKSNAHVAYDGEHPFIRLQIGENQGEGIGNLSMVGLVANGPQPLSLFEGLGFDLRVPAESPQSLGAAVVLLVDLTCEGGTPSVIVIDGSVWSLPAKGAWGRHSFTPSDSIYRAVNGAGGLPSLRDDEAAPLVDLLSSYPDACLVNADPADRGLPEDTVLPAISLILGDRLQMDAATLDIDNLHVSVNGESMGLNLP